jgi:hypothetical protein
VSKFAVRRYISSLPIVGKWSWCWCGDSADPCGRGSKGRGREAVVTRCTRHKEFCSLTLVFHLTAGLQAYREYRRAQRGHGSAKHAFWHGRRRRCGANHVAWMRKSKPPCRLPMPLASSPLSRNLVAVWSNKIKKSSRRRYIAAAILRRLLPLHWRIQFLYMFSKVIWAWHLRLSSKSYDVL